MVNGQVTSRFEARGLTREALRRFGRTRTFEIVTRGREQFRRVRTEALRLGFRLVESRSGGLTRAQVETRRAEEFAAGGSTPVTQEILFTPTPAADIARARPPRRITTLRAPVQRRDQLFTPTPVADRPRPSALQRLESFRQRVSPDIPTLQEIREAPVGEQRALRRQVVTRIFPVPIGGFQAVGAVGLATTFRRLGERRRTAAEERRIRQQETRLQSLPLERAPLLARVTETETFGFILGAGFGGVAGVAATEVSLRAFPARAEVFARETARITQPTGEQISTTKFIAQVRQGFLGRPRGQFAGTGQFRIDPARRGVSRIRADLTSTEITPTRFGFPARPTRIETAGVARRIGGQRFLTFEAGRITPPGRVPEFFGTAGRQGVSRAFPRIAIGEAETRLRTFAGQRILQRGITILQPERAFTSPSGFIRGVGTIQRPVGGRVISANIQRGIEQQFRAQAGRRATAAVTGGLAGLSIQQFTRAFTTPQVQFQAPPQEITTFQPQRQVPRLVPAQITRQPPRQRLIQPFITTQIPRAIQVTSLIPRQITRTVQLQPTIQLQPPVQRQPPITTTQLQPQIQPPFRPTTLRPRATGRFAPPFFPPFPILPKLFDRPTRARRGVGRQELGFTPTVVGIERFFVAGITQPTIPTGIQLGFGIRDVPIQFTTLRRKKKKKMKRGKK